MRQKFVKENETVKVCSYNGKVFSVEAPLFVELEITDTEPGFKGDTATGATKPATLETGAQINVPLFVNQGDRKVKIDIALMSITFQSLIHAVIINPRKPYVHWGFVP